MLPLYYSMCLRFFYLVGSLVGISIAGKGCVRAKVLTAQQNECVAANFKAVHMTDTVA